MRVRIPVPPRGSTHPTRRAAYVFGLLFMTVVTVLIFEGSVLDLSHDPRRRSFPLRRGDNSRLLHDEFTASVVSSSVETLKHLELESWMHESDPVGEVPSDERLHMSLLQAACIENRDVILPWTFGKPGLDQLSGTANQKELIFRDDPELLEKLGQCPDVDIFLPEGIRGHGYCEDATAYAKFLKSRLLPSWAIKTPFFNPSLGRTVTYHELCPKTPIILFNHYWDDVHVAPDFPKDKPVYLMPNIEMYELNEKHFWRVDVVLCKTRDCYNRLTQWYAQEGNPRNTEVFYTKHTSSDLANFAKTRLGTDAIAPKDFKNTRFTHTVGGSTGKGTRQVLDCWLSRPNFPPLDLYIHEGNYKGYKAEYDDRIRASQINLNTETVDAVTFGKAFAEASFFLCTSSTEGYGHYINQARASGGVIITPDVPPMNELISSSDMGVYVDSTRHTDQNSFLSGAYRGPHGLKYAEGMTAHTTKEDVCKAVEQVVFNLTPSKRQAMAVRAQQQYHADTKFFARKMLQLRHFATLEVSARGAKAVARLRREE